VNKLIFVHCETECYETVDVRTYGNAKYFLADHQPGVRCMIAPLQMATMSGIALLEALNQRNANIPLIFFAERTDVASAVAAMKAGAADVIEAPYNERTVITAIDGAIEFGDRAHRYTTEIQAGRDLAAKLTPRERNVLDQVAKGHSNKMAAFELGISARTVEFHRARIMEKLDAQHCADLVRAALAIERAAETRHVFNSCNPTEQNKGDCKAIR